MRWFACVGMLVGLACAALPPASGPAPDSSRPSAVEPAAAPGPDSARARPAVGPGRPSGEWGVGRLPEIPRVRDSLRVHVQYPERLQRVAAHDSNFVFGSVGTGDARLSIDGREVPVEANGAFLAWLPLPERVAGDTAVYRLVARRGPEVDSLDYPVRLPREPLRGPPDRAWVDTLSFRDGPERWALPDEKLEVSLLGAPGMDVWLEIGKRRLPLREVRRAAVRLGGEVRPEAPDEVAASYRARVPAGRLGQTACAGGPDAPGCGPGPELDTVRMVLRATLGGDTLRLARRWPLRILRRDALPTVRLREAPDSVNGAAGVIVGRPTPFGPYRWRFPPGTRARVDGRVGDRLRIRLTPRMGAWVLVEDTEPADSGLGGDTAEVRDVRAESAPEGISIRLGIDSPVPVEVREPDPRTLILTLFGTLGSTDRMAYGREDLLLDSMRWEQVAGVGYRLIVRLREPVWGYRVRYERGEAEAHEGPGRAAGSSSEGVVLRLEVRRPPRIDRSHPLRGRRIAVDPGHPGAGAWGPTGLYEGDANLAIATRLVRMLRKAGAIPIQLRADTLPLGLYERTERARQAGAEIFVSIHNNALPDGVRPFGREGTGTYYYHPHSLPLAAAVQAGMLHEMGLRDLGVTWGDLAVTRMSWMPAVLTEGAFMMIPRHEAALRTPDFQDRYARGVLEGIREFLRSRSH
ncbi:MAG: N-acetylmuramoyl-L-alanine amidase [Gemmatimonadota bacterium]